MMELLPNTPRYMLRDIKRHSLSNSLNVYSNDSAYSPATTHRNNLLILLSIHSFIQNIYSNVLFPLQWAKQFQWRKKAKEFILDAFFNINYCF